MRITWVNPVFLDYRVPVYKALDDLAEGGLTLIFSKRRTPPAVCEKIAAALGARAVGLAGERLLTSGNGSAGFANAGYTVPYQKGLYRAIAASLPEVLIGDGFFQWTPVALLYKLLHRVPLVIAYERTAHTERNAARVRVVYRRLVARMTDAVACNGRLSKEFCRDRLGIAETRIVTGAMAADIHALQARIASVDEDSRQSLIAAHKAAFPVFLCVGRLVRPKGVCELLDAWTTYTRTAEAGGTLVLAGDGPERAWIESAVRTRQLANVALAGSIPYDQIAQYYAIADVLVMPTLEDNWSLVVPEAMSCGLPIVCSCYNGCWPELVRENENGWVFDPLNAGEFAQVLLACSRQKERLAGMGQASRGIVQAFSPASAAGAVLKACRIAAGETIE
jgi:glycosyltransferase involved in cell wall biosynthesis